MRIFRSEESLFNESLRTQVLELFLFPLSEGASFEPSFEDLLDVCECEEVRRDLLGVIVGLLDDRLLVEGSNHRFLLVQPNEAMIQTGFFPEDCLDLVPDGVKVFCLSERVERAVAEKGRDEAVKDLVAELTAEMMKEVN